MERVGTLIEKLKEQFEKQADIEHLSITARLLLSELEHQAPQSSSTKKVSVVMPVSAWNPVPVAEQKILPLEVKPTISKPPQQKKDVQNTWLFDPVAIPTMAHQEQREVYELNDVAATQNGSLNDKLKEDTSEVASLLQSTPIRDLKKAIGINDRYLFINELFRGDDNMYERSIKTINAFTIYAEAEYWIQRELKVKIGWNDNLETVKHFDQLVKRRFT
jgi:hypothetical protein